jgi:hypothetical protein
MSEGGYIKHGVHPELEDEANRIIRESLKGVTKRSAKADILTPWKEQDRKAREVYVASGTPDSSERQGMFHRAYNPARPELNSRDGVSRAAARTRVGMGRPGVDIDGLSDFYASHRPADNASGDPMPLDLS